MNITRYVKINGNKTFDELPLNPVDSLILSQLSYLKFDGVDDRIYLNNEGVCIKDIAESDKVADLFGDVRYANVNKGLFDAAAASERFGTIKLSNYVDIIDADAEIQFSAVTATCSNGLTYVVYRGTDDNLVGWQEDFNMIYKTPVPAQEKAVWYLNLVSEKIEGDFYVGGHSKGGNLAVYASMFVNESIQNRIINVFSHDGPGFKKEILEGSGFFRIKDKILKYVPRESIFGLMQATTEKYEVVLCHKRGISQHSPFNWIVNGYDFKYADNVENVYILRNKIFNIWASKITDEQAKDFSENFFAIFREAGFSNLNDFQGDLLAKYGVIKSLISAMENVDEETKAELMEVITLYKDIFTDTTKESVQDARDNALENVQHVMDNVKESVQTIKSTVDSKKEKKSTKKRIRNKKEVVE